VHQSFPTFLHYVAVTSWHIRGYDKHKKILSRYLTRLQRKSRMGGSDGDHRDEHFFYLYNGGESGPYVIDPNKPTPLVCKVLAVVIAVFYWIQLLNNY
jgi:hypothetical protein